MAPVVAVVHTVVMPAVVAAVVAPVLRRDGGRGEQHGGQHQDAQDFLHRYSPLVKTGRARPLYLRAWRVSTELEARGLNPPTTD
jgi:hypothetical protein